LPLSTKNMPYTKHNERSEARNNGLSFRDNEKLVWVPNYVEFQKPFIAAAVFFSPQAVGSMIQVLITSGVRTTGIRG